MTVTGSQRGSTRDRLWNGRLGLASLVPVSLAIAPLGRADAQLTSIAGTPACDRCELRATRRLTLATDEHDVVLTDAPASVARDSRGTYYVAQRTNPPFAFDSRGRFLRHVGRKGKGPGEVEEALAVLVGPGDSLHVIEFFSGRRSVFSPSGTFVRLMQLQGNVGIAVMLPNGNMAINRGFYEAFRDGAPLQIVGPDGKASPPFGGNQPIPLQGDQQRLTRQLGLARGGNIWAAHYKEYRFSLWSPDGRLVREYERTNDFFRPDEPYVVQTDRTTPPRITSIHEDAAGLVWVTVQVSAPPDQWNAALGEPRPAPNGRTTYPQQMRGRMYHMLIEVFDVAAGTLVASQRFPFSVTDALGDGEYAAYRQDENGVPYVDIWRVELVRR